MVRKPVAFVVALYAIAFAFLAMTAVRWPTIMTAVALVFREGSADLSGFDWRGVGLHFGIPYLVAAVFFQISSFALATRQHGAVTAFVFGCATGFPSVFVLDFRREWWIAPSQGEWIAVWLAGGTLLVLGSVWDLRRRPAPEAPRTDQTAAVPMAAGLPFPTRKQTSRKSTAQEKNVAAAAPEKPKTTRKPQLKYVPPAVARNRQRWAAEGRRARSPRGGTGHKAGDRPDQRPDQNPDQNPDENR